MSQLTETPENMTMPSWLKPNVVVYDWCYYKGEKVFVSLNFNESEKRQKPVMDIAYCATKAANEVFLKQRIWNKYFQPC